MADPRVAVYIDFDNIVISRYDQLFDSGAWRKDNARDFTMGAKGADAVSKRLEEARVDIGAILEYATTFGSIAFTRAYAVWSAPANASYKVQLVDPSVDLTQLFNVSGTKNGADIRLAVDVTDDLFRFESISHVVLVAGDSDYIPLVTRCKRMGREVIGLGIAGSTSRAFVRACDKFTVYDDVPGVPKVGGRAATKPRVETTPVVETNDSDKAATELLIRALQLIDDKNDEEWQTNAETKNQMLRMDGSFREKSLGFKSFTDFLNSRQDVIEIKPKSKANDRRLKLR
jgi:hypothetical protein